MHVLETSYACDQHTRLKWSTVNTAESSTCTSRLQNHRRVGDRVWQHDRSVQAYCIQRHDHVDGLASYLERNRACVSQVSFRAPSVAERTVEMP